MEAINVPTTEISEALGEWKINRDLIAGERAVKLGGDLYMPRPGGIMATDPVTKKRFPVAMNDADFGRYIERTPFFAAAAATASFWRGMVFRKKAARTWNDSFQKVADTITNDGKTIDDLAEYVFDEVVATNFIAVLADFPADDGKPKNYQDAFEKGHRPFVYSYAAESILEVRSAVWRNARVIDRVRLLEDDDDAPNGKRVRELRLDLTGDTPIYSQVVWTEGGNGAFTPGEPKIVRKAGVPLDAIPFRVVSTKARATAPTKAPISDLARANLAHYRISAAISTSNHYVAHPIAVITGADPTDAISIAPGAVWQFDKPEAKAYYLQVSGKNESLVEARDKIEVYMAKLGSQILAPEKNGVEAAETLALRSASERANLAAIATMISRALTDILNAVSDWIGLGEVGYALNTDYNVAPLDLAGWSIYRDLRDRTLLSQKTIYEILKHGDRLPDTFDAQDEIDRLEEENPMYAQIPGDEPQAETQGQPPTGDPQTDGPNI